MPVDLVWQSLGGLLLDGSGDLASTTGDTADVQSIGASRLNAATDGWKLYTFGANLQSVLGQTVSQEVETALQRAAVQSLTSDGFLDGGAIDVVVLGAGSQTLVLVYLHNQLIAQAGIANTQLLQGVA